MKIEIDLTGPNKIAVRCGDRWDDHLTCDEALWVVSCILSDSARSPQHRPVPYLRTKEEWEAYEARLRGVRREEALVPYVPLRSQLERALGRPLP